MSQKSKLIRKEAKQTFTKRFIV